MQPIGVAAVFGTRKHHAFAQPAATPNDPQKDANLARVLTLSALYFITLGMMFGAYAMTL
jgi:hypothetical protein